MIRTFKYPAYPNPRMAQGLDVMLGQCCDLFNASLEQRVTEYKEHGRSIGVRDQQKDLTKRRAADPAWEAVSVHVQRSALHRLDRAMKGFFTRCKNGEKPGFPRFRSKKHYTSLTINKSAWWSAAKIVDKGRLHIPKLGPLKLKLYRPIVGEILDVTIYRDAAQRWWVSFACEVGDPPPLIPPAVAAKNAVGIDLGLTTLATLSNGEPIKNPKYGLQGAVVLARRQRKFDRATEGSKSRERAGVLVAKEYVHVTNQRREYAREVAKDLCVRFSMIAHEDTKGGMLRSLKRGRFSKSFHDVSWGLLLQCLMLKAASAGVWLVPVDPRLTSQLCSGCGLIVKKTLMQRKHDCPHCGLVLGRDHNSAIVILTRGLRVLELAQAGVEGEVLTTIPSTKHGRAGAPLFENPSDNTTDTDT